MCLLRTNLPNLCPNMIHVDALDFSECHSEEVISFFWRSVYDAKSKGKFGRQVHVDMWIDCTVWVHQLVLAEVNLSRIWKSWSVEYTTFAPATIALMVNANVKHNRNPNPNPNLNPYPTLNKKPNHYPHSNSSQEQLSLEQMLDHLAPSSYRCYSAAQCYII